MNPFKKIKIGISAKFEQLANEMENHEAIVNEAIKDLKQGLGKINIQINHSVERSSHYQNQMNKSQNEIVLWTERAKNIHSQDQQKARDCIKKVIDNRCQFKQAQQYLEQNEQNLENLKIHKKMVESKLEEFLRRNELLVCRQAQSTCLPSSQGSHSLSDFEDLFKRWEDKIVMNETITTCCHPFIESQIKKESLETYFEEEELHREISDELKKIIKS